MDSSPRHSLPFLLPNQAQKHVTLNESLRALDVMTALSVVSRSVSSQPASPLEGDCYILPAGFSGAAWDSFAAGRIADGA